MLTYMKEGAPNSFESGAERIPTPEEMYSMFGELTKKEYTETRELEDEKGIYLLEVTVPGDEQGEVIEYSYMRKGVHSKRMQSLETVIHVTYYKDGSPISGTSAARFIDGTWTTL